MKRTIIILFFIHSSFCFGQNHPDPLKSNDYVLSLAQGDSCFLAKNYLIARNFFSHASDLKPTETYPKSRILECNKFILLNSTYKNKILNGDLCRLKMKYKEAKTFYQEALKLKPTEQYPKDKIKEMDDLIRSEKKK